MGIISAVKSAVSKVTGDSSKPASTTSSSSSSKPASTTSSSSSSKPASTTSSSSSSKPASTTSSSSSTPIPKITSLVTSVSSQSKPSTSTSTGPTVSVSTSTSSSSKPSTGPTVSTSTSTSSGSKTSTSPTTGILSTPSILQSVVTPTTPTSTTTTPTVSTGPRIQTSSTSTTSTTKTTTPTTTPTNVVGTAKDVLSGTTIGSVQLASAVENIKDQKIYEQAMKTDFTKNIVLPKPGETISSTEQKSIIKDVSDLSTYSKGQKITPSSEITSTYDKTTGQKIYVQSALYSPGEKVKATLEIGGDKAAEYLGLKDTTPDTTTEKIFNVVDKAGSGITYGAGKTADFILKDIESGLKTGKEIITAPVTIYKTGDVTAPIKNIITAQKDKLDDSKTSKTGKILFGDVNKPVTEFYSQEAQKLSGKEMYEQVKKGVMGREGYYITKEERLPEDRKVGRFFSGVASTLTNTKTFDYQLQRPQILETGQVIIKNEQAYKSSPLENIRTEMKTLSESIKKDENFINNLNEQYSLGNIPVEEYNTLRAEYDTKFNTLDSLNSMYDKELSRLEQTGAIQTSGAYYNAPLDLSKQADIDKRLIGTQLVSFGMFDAGEEARASAGAKVIADVGTTAENFLIGAGAGKLASGGASAILGKNLGGKVATTTVKILGSKPVRAASEGWSGEVVDIAQGALGQREEIQQAIAEKRYSDAGSVLLYGYAKEKVGDKLTGAGYGKASDTKEVFRLSATKAPEQLGRLYEPVSTGKPTMLQKISQTTGIELKTPDLRTDVRVFKDLPIKTQQKIDLSKLSKAEIKGATEADIKSGRYGLDKVPGIKADIKTPEVTVKGTRAETQTKTTKTEKADTVRKEETFRLPKDYKIEKTEKLDKTEQRLDKPFKIDKIEKLEKLDRVEQRVEKPFKIDKVERIDKIDKVERGGFELAALPTGGLPFGRTGGADPFGWGKGSRQKTITNKIRDITGRAGFSITPQQNGIKPYVPFITTGQKTSQYLKTTSNKRDIRSLI